MSTLYHQSPVQVAQQHLNQLDLARRWRMSERTLERWRWQKSGPPYLKVGGRVIYRLDDVLTYEAAQRRTGDL
ncbi:MAG: helix-turn-helix transcriptional regulator [Pirellulaceae bacterium]